MDKEAKQIVEEGQPLAFPLYNEWHIFRKFRKELFALKGKDYTVPEQVKGSTRSMIENQLKEYEFNRLAYFLPHGADKGGGKDFLNDWENDICLLTAPTRTGKSCHGVAFSLLRTLECQPDWHLFNHHGIDYHEWRGERRLVISSYEWTNVQELWDEYIKWIPRKMLGNYAPEYGKYPEETGSPKTVNLKTGNVAHLRLPEGGIDILFRCDKQAQGAWEGQRWDDAHFDEQRRREKFIGYLRGTDNTPGRVQCCFTLTGHVLDDRPDTGASGWIKTELYDGGYTFGRTVGRYKLDIPHTPNVVMTAKTKHRLHKQWVLDPTENQDEETLRKAEARYHGGWESGSGLVLYNFKPEIHKIPPIKNVNNPILREATRYRGIDHGLSRPCACVWGMVFPWGDLVITREYYKKHGIIPQHAEEIVKLSGNKKVKYGLYYDKKSRASFDRFKEEFTSERYQASVLDSRSFASPGQESDRTIGQQYNQYGLSCRASKGWRNEKIVPQMLAMLEPDPKKPHIMTEFYKRGVIGKDEYDLWLKARKGNPNMGCRLYFTRDLNFTFKEIVRWANNVKTGKPEDKNDHIVGGALKYLIGENPKFFGDHTKLHYGGDTLREVDEEPEVKRKSRFKYINGY